MWNNPKAEGMEKHGLKITTMHLSNEVVDGQMKRLVKEKQHGHFMFL